MAERRQIDDENPIELEDQDQKSNNTENQIKREKTPWLFTKDIAFPMDLQQSHQEIFAN